MIRILHRHKEEPWLLSLFLFSCGLFEPITFSSFLSQPVSDLKRMTPTTLLLLSLLKSVKGKWHKNTNNSSPLHSLTLTLRLCLSLFIFSLLWKSSKPLHCRSHSLMSPKALRHQETVNTTSQCHKTGLFPGLGSCLHILSTAPRKIKTLLYCLAQSLWMQCSGRDTQRELVWGSEVQFKRPF